MNTLPEVIRLGTRGSLLARTQSQMIADLLTPHLPPGHRIELVTITTSGDRQQEQRLQDSGGKGLFVKELDEAMLREGEGRVDFTVHSAKDVPAERPAGLVIAATPRREDCRDVWIGRDGMAIEQLPQGAKVGTASLRRQAQLLAHRPDLQVIALRGNIDTRLRKVAEGFDGISGTFLAAAGLNRTGLLPPPPAAQPLEVEDFIPAAGQGILAIEARAGDEALIELLRKIHDPQAEAALRFERGIVAALAGSCLAPIGVCAVPRAGEAGQGWIVRGIVARPDGKEAARCALMDRSGKPGALERLEGELLRALEGRGAREILARL